MERYSSREEDNYGAFHQMVHGQFGLVSHV